VKSFREPRFGNRAQLRLNGSVKKTNRCRVHSSEGLKKQNKRCIYVCKITNRCRVHSFRCWATSEVSSNPKPHAGKGEATSQQHHRGQQSVRHEVTQAWGAVKSSCCLSRCLFSYEPIGLEKKETERGNASAPGEESIDWKNTGEGGTINQSKSSKSHTRAREKPHPSSTTGGSKPCVTKWRRLGGLWPSRNSTSLLRGRSAQRKKKTNLDSFWPVLWNPCTWIQRSPRGLQVALATWIPNSLNKTRWFFKFIRGCAFSFFSA